jgi:hypothetical protein
MFSFFTRSKIECPRCLGKGNVDDDDIKRLGQELRWMPGKCAYCNGNGKVTTQKLAKVKADNSYLTLDIGQAERKLLFFGDRGALQRAKNFDDQANLFIAQIEYLHFSGKMEAEAIADFFLIERIMEIFPNERQEFIEYVGRVVSKKSENN